MGQQVHRIGGGYEFDVRELDALDESAAADPKGEIRRWGVRPAEIGHPTPTAEVAGQEAA